MDDQELGWTPSPGVCLPRFTPRETSVCVVETHEQWVARLVPQPIAYDGYLPMDMGRVFMKPWFDPAGRGAPARLLDADGVFEVNTESSKGNIGKRTYFERSGGLITRFASDMDTARGWIDMPPWFEVVRQQVEEWTSGMPQLYGSDAQVTWALMIRVRVVRECHPDLVFSLWGYTQAREWIDANTLPPNDFALKAACHVIGGCGKKKAAAAMERVGRALADLAYDRAKQRGEVARRTIAEGPSYVRRIPLNQRGLKRILQDESPARLAWHARWSERLAESTAVMLVDKLDNGADDE